MTSKTLTGIARLITLLEISCARCDRTGRMSVARLINQYSTVTLLADLGTMLVADCANARVLISFMKKYWGSYCGNTNH
jgi:hypothetical protein